MRVWLSTFERNVCVGRFFFFSSRRRHTRCSRDWSSDVCSSDLFIATANWMDPIPEPLRDRMEIIELPGYTGEEKLQIAHKYLIPKQASEHGLKVDEQIHFTDEGLREIIHSYTREAGVRNLEREIATITRDRKSTRLNSSHGYISY